MSKKPINLFTALCGVLGMICYIAFFIGVRQDNDGQGTSMN